MDISLTKQFLLSCHTAKAICESMPKLPAGLTPRNIRVIDTIHYLQKQQEIVNVSDVSRLMDSTAPSITRLLHGLAAKGYVTKVRQEDDHRAFSLRLTPKGEKIYQYYVYDFHHWLNDRLSDISPEDMETTIRTIQRVAEEIQPIKSLFPDKSAPAGYAEHTKQVSGVSSKKES